jgi:preprotein translocase subunit SecF
LILILGVFSVLGHFYGTEINTPFVAAVLTILGYSISDTIVIFDRIRENLPKSNEDFENTVNRSLNQTLTRSFNTSFSSILALLAVIFLGGAQ